MQLLDACADINAQPTLYGSALHVAVAFGHLDLTKLLLQRGAGINATAAYRSGLSALHEASTNGHLEVVKHLRGTWQTRMDTLKLSSYFWSTGL